jgi:GNAT superfamily N-acetyltransferase
MSEVVIRAMTNDDVPAGMRLRELARWNQNEQDWRRFLDLEPSGCFVACVGDKVRGTVTTLNYERRFGWVSMVLVDPEHRRQGIGTVLLEKGIESLDAAGVETVKLDATPMGRMVYVQRGFVDEYGVERWEGTARSMSRASLEPVKEQDLAEVCERDRSIFGADRARLISALWRENPSYSGLARSGREITGYVFGRSGSNAHYLGPWVSLREEVVEELLVGFLRRFDGERVFVDVCLENPLARSLVQSAGFEFQRPFTRMYRGPNNYPGTPRFVCGTAGPELG